MTPFVLKTEINNNFLQTFYLTISTIASKINIIKIAVNATSDIFKIHKIRNGRRIQTNIYKRVETLDDSDS